MKNKKTIQLVIFAIVLVVGIFTIASNLKPSSSKVPVAGDKAPDFTLVDLQGNPHKLSDTKAKVTVVNFWGTFCPPCREEMPDLQHQYDKWRAQGVEVLAVNLGENKVTVQSFVTPLGLNFPILLNGEDVRRIYGVRDYPTTFFVDSKGHIQVKQIGQMTADFIDRTISGMLGS
jgi:peroxiredoxin